LWNLQMLLHHTWIHPPSFPFILPPPPPIPGIVSTGLIFLFTYMYTQYLNYIHPPMPFPHLPPPTGTNPPGRTCSTLLFSDINKHLKKKKYKWPVNTWKKIQPLYPSGKCKSKLHWDSISPIRMATIKKKKKPTNVGKDAERGRGLWYPVGENIH
jgi:hypothetical protein